MIFDPNRRISKILCGPDCNGDGKLVLPKRKVETKLVKQMSRNLQLRVFNGLNLEVDLKYARDGTVHNVKFEFTGNAYVLTDFDLIITHYGLNPGDFVQLYPVFGEVFERTTMEFSFMRKNEINP